MREIVNDVIGPTRKNVPVFDMISKVSSEVQQTRQQFREYLPEKLANEFTRPVTQPEWTAMFKALGRTDLAALAAHYRVSGALQLLTDNQRVAAEIHTLEQSIQAAEGQRAGTILKKARQLSVFQLTGEHGPKLLRNATAIAHLFGERGLSQANLQNPQVVDEIDRLVTLYALQALDHETKTTMAILARTENAGLDFLLSYLVGQRKEELAKTNSPIARINHYKGHIPSEAKQGGSLIITSDTEYGHLIGRGYTRLSGYTGSSADRTLGSMSYFFAPVSGTAPFSQGVLQTVHLTASGIDPETGYTVGEIMAGRIVDPQMVRLVIRQIANQSNTREQLLPVFDDNGNVTAFERAPDVAKLVNLNRSTHLAQMIGVWRGRQVEEMFAQEINNQLVDELYKIWQQGQNVGRRNEFVNLVFRH